MAPIRGGNRQNAVKIIHSRVMLSKSYHTLTTASGKALSHVMTANIIHLCDRSEKHIITLRTTDVEKNLENNSIVISFGLRGNVLSV